MSEVSIPRRADSERHYPAEHMIRAAMLSVEDIGADTRLTDAIIFLEKAQNSVADFYDNAPSSSELSIGDVVILKSEFPDHRYSEESPMRMTVESINPSLTPAGKIICSWIDTECHLQREVFAREAVIRLHAVREKRPDGGSASQ